MNTQSQPKHNVLVIAANGKTGRRVADLLTKRGVHVRRGSRSGSPAFDWNTPETWAGALSGMDAAYVVYTPDLAVPSAPSDITRFTQLAAEMGVKKLVLLSGRGEPEAQRCERIVQESGLAWTIVRASWFNQNFDEGEFEGMVQSGVITLPNPDALEPFVDADDIAEVAAAALMESRHDGEVYEVTGPELLAFTDIAQQISEASGRSVAYHPITIVTFAAGLKEAGVPDGFIELLRYLFDRMATGDNAHIADGVERALGRPARSFREFAERAASKGAWSRANEEVSHG